MLVISLLPVNKKHIYRLMKENALLVTKKTYKAKRKPTYPKPKACYPNHILPYVTKRFPAGIKDRLVESLYLVSDNGCQPTSLSYMKGCSDLGIKQIFTSWYNPKGNADTERVIRTLKEDLVWCYDWIILLIFKEH